MPTKHILKNELESKDPVIEWSIGIDEYGAVTLIGNGRRILLISESGKLYRQQLYEEMPGLKLDDLNRIELGN